MPTGLTSWRSTRRRERANSENTHALNSRWGDSTISAPNDGGWYQTTSSREATPMLSAGEWTSPETAYDDSSPEIEIVRDDYEDGIYLAHERGYVASAAQDKEARGTITITIPLPWAKKSTRRSTSAPPEPDRPRINSASPDLSGARFLPKLDTSEYLVRDTQRALRPSPIERSRKTVSPIMTRGTTKQLPLLTPVVERSEKSPGIRPTHIVIVGSDSDQESIAVRPKHRPTPIKTTSTPAQRPEMTPATLAFGNPLNSHPPSQRQNRSQSSKPARPTSYLAKSLTTPGLGLGSTMYMRSPSVDTFTRNLNPNVHTSASSVSPLPQTPVHKKYQSTYRRSRSVDPAGTSDTSGYANRHNLQLPTPLVTSFNRRSSTTTSSSDDVPDDAITPVELDPKSAAPEAYYESRRQWNGVAGEGRTGFYANVKNDYKLIGKDVDKVEADRRSSRDEKETSGRQKERQRRAERQREKEKIEEELRILENLEKLHVEREKDWGFVELALPVGGQRLVAPGEELYG